VADTGPEGSLARTHEGKPGLPRGRNRLPPRAVQTSHRERLQRSVTAAVADAGYTAVTVADIVQGARVSRSVFYAHFADKEDCFLSATRAGGRLMSGPMAAERLAEASHRFANLNRKWHGPLHMAVLAARPRTA
jgi:AcrR family transcriptional regulator